MPLEAGHLHPPGGVLLELIIGHTVSGYAIKSNILKDRAQREGTRHMHGFGEATDFSSTNATLKKKPNRRVGSEATV